MLQARGLMLQSEFIREVGTGDTSASPETPLRE